MHLRFHHVKNTLNKSCVACFHVGVRCLCVHVLFFVSLTKCRGKRSRRKWHRKVWIKRYRICHRVLSGAPVVLSSHPSRSPSPLMQHALIFSYAYPWRTWLLRSICFLNMKSRVRTPRKLCRQVTAGAIMYVYKPEHAFQ